MDIIRMWRTQSGYIEGSMWRVEVDIESGMWRIEVDVEDGMWKFEVDIEGGMWGSRWILRVVFGGGGEGGGQRGWCVEGRGGY